MAGLTAAVANARPGQPGPTTVDASQITCGQLLSTDPALQSVVVPWMSGWFMSTKNLTNVDIRYVDRNGGVIRNFCKRNRNVGLMDAIGQNWR
jgi:acid stress chaperone HdeB